MRTLKVLGFLLTYPSAQTVEVLDECREILASEKWLDDATLSSLGNLMDWMAKTDLLDLQEDYVSLFDRTPSLSLHLFEHIHGDSKERGQAMVDLSNVYEDAGLIIDTKELPDYLPLFLEYLSVISLDEARDNLAEVINITGILSKRLKNRDSLYSSVLDALANAAACQPDADAVEEALKKSTGAPFTFEEMDEEWEEHNAFANTQQTTGQDMDGGCPIAQEMLDRMNLPTSKEEA
ncbi:MAG: nitrate reductase molybdenum cofactor assembly chaperone [Alphaproteobacteria bacterium]